MRKRILSVLMALCMVLSLAPTMAWAEAGNITVSDATYHATGALKSITTNFTWYQGGADGRLVLTSRYLDGQTGESDNGWGAFSNKGWVNSLNLSTFDAVLAHGSASATDKEEKSFEIISYGKNNTTFSSGNYELTLSLDEGAIPLSKDGMYYVYLWVNYYGRYYPDNLICAIRVNNGAVEYVGASDTNNYRNKYNSSAFTKVKSEDEYDVTVIAGANMTKTDGSGAVSQADLKTAMTPVEYTADEGYYFPEDYAVATKNGIMVRRDSDSQITVYGTPSADAEITLTAPTAVPTYTVSFDKNGGEGTMADITDVSGEYTLPECGFTAPAGQKFDGWQVGEDKKAVGEKITVTADTEVKALWEKIAVEEVDFGYAYDVQRDPDYPTGAGTKMTLSSATTPLNSDGNHYTENAANYWELTKVGTYSYTKTLEGLSQTAASRLDDITATIANKYSDLNQEEIVIHKLTRAGEHVAYGVVIAYDAEGGYAVFLGDNWGGGAGYLLSKTALSGTSKEITITEIATDFVQDLKVELDPSTFSFANAQFGYGAQTAKTITVTNTGNDATGDLTVSLSGANAADFELSATSISSIAKDGSATFTVAPKIDLEVGTYSASVNVSGQNIVTKTATFDFEVTAAPVVNYDVTVTNDGNGTATATPTSAAADAEITLTATPNSGYRFKEWQVVSGGVTITDNKFTMPAEDVEVKACFEAIPSTPSRPSSSKPTYPAKVEEKADLENGAISFSKDRVRAGRTVTITVTPDAGYVLDKLVILDDDGKAVSFKDNGNGTYTFTMPVGGVEVEPFFVKAAPAKEPVTLVLFVNQVAYLLDGEPLVNDVAPIIKAERTTLPIRLVAETLGAKVDWSEADQTVTITKDDMTIVIYIGQGFALVNGDPVELDCPAYIANSRTYLPVRFVSENLGAEVTWGGADGSVTIVVE